MGKGGDEILDALPICNAFSDSGPSFLLPATLDLSALLGQHQLTGEWATPKRADKLACVIHLIIEGGLRNPRIEHEGYFVPLHSRRLGELLGTGFAPAAMKALRALGIIEANDRYLVNNFSKSYRLARCYRSAAVRFQPVRDVSMTRKLESCVAQDTVDSLARNPSRHAIWEAVQAVSLDASGFSFAASFPYHSNHQRAAWLLAARDFSQGRHWFRADENTGRVFHNVTQCPRELRGFLRIDGQETAEVDIAAAQPFFALSLFPENHPEITEYARLATSPDFYAGLFYRMAAAKRKSWGTEFRAWTAPGSTHRDRFKRHVLRHVFYDVVPTERVLPVFEALRTVSPWLAGHLAMSRCNKAGTSALAQLLQSKEAELMLGRVVPRIRRELPHCRAITIHDGVLCPMQFATAVQRIVQEESERMFGFQAVVRVKEGRSGLLCSAA